MMNWRLPLIIPGLLFSGVTLGFAQSPVQMEIRATISSVTDEHNLLGGHARVGDAVTGVVTYTKKSADKALRSEAVAYEFATGAAIQITAGNQRFQSDPSQLKIRIEIVNDLPDAAGGKKDVFLLRSYNNLPSTTGLRVENISWQLEDPSGKAFSEKALPKDLLKLSQWESPYGLVINGSAANNEERSYEIRAHVSSLAPAR